MDGSARSGCSVRLNVEFLKRKSVQQELKFRDLAALKAYIRQAKRLESMWVVFDGDDPGCHQLVPIIEEAVGFEFQLPTFHVYPPRPSAQCVQSRAIVRDVCGTGTWHLDVNVRGRDSL